MTTNTLLVIIIILLIIGNIDIPIARMPIIHLFNGSLSIFDILVMAFLIWIATKLGSPFREIIGLIIILWLLSALGVFIFFSGFLNILLFLILIILLLSFF